MSAETLCERLLHDPASAHREAWLEAATQPECVTYLLQSAQERMSESTSEAIPRAQLAALLAERDHDGQAAAQSWRLVGQARRRQGDHAAAADALETASVHALRAGDSRLAAQVQIGRVDSLNWLGRYDEAIALARRLEAELRAHSEGSDAAKVLANLGSIYYRRDQYAAALTCYERAAETFAQSGEDFASATVQTNVAAVLMELHRIDEAIILFEQARAAFAALEQWTPAAKIDANVGFLHYISGRYAQAVTVLERAREEFTARGHTLDAAKCDADVAEVYRELNLYPEAQDAYSRAAAEMQTRGIAYEQARVELGRAAVYIALERPDEALECLDRAEKQFTVHRNAVQRARVRLMRARLLRGSGRREDARQEAQRAAQTLQRNGLRGWAAEARLLLAEMTEEEGGDASRSLHTVLSAAKATARGWLECRAERALGRHYLTKGDSMRGLRHLEAGVEALERARTLIAPEEMHISFLRDKIGLYEETVSALLARGGSQNIARALEYVERAKSRLLLERVLSALEGRSPAESELPEETRSRLAVLRAELSRGYHRLNSSEESETRRMGAAGADDAASLNALEQEYTELLRREERKPHASPSLFTLPDIVAAHDLAGPLQADEALLVYYILHGFVCVWIVTSQQIHFLPRVACLEDVNRTATRMRYQLQRAGGGSELSRKYAARFQVDAKAVFGQLYDLLLRPIASLLTAEKLVVVPYDVLHGLPFHAFFDGSQSALDRWEIVYAPSAALWYRGAQRGHAPPEQSSVWNDTTALLVSVPSLGIEQVTEEVTQLAQILPNAVVLQAEEATLKSVQARAGSCRLLHLATHALYRADNPLFSGLQLADGWLLARDLYAMTLSCDLATLSACQTGMTLAEAGDELFGLIRGFLASGVRSVAASLWPADDAATAALMQEFYGRLALGHSRASALRGAQQTVRERFPHPYHWAAFMLVGERGHNTVTGLPEIGNN